MVRHSNAVSIADCARVRPVLLAPRSPHTCPVAASPVHHTIDNSVYVYFALDVCGSCSMPSVPFTTFRAREELLQSEQTIVKFDFAAWDTSVLDNPLNKGVWRS